MPDSDTPVLDDSHTVRVSLEERMESAYLDYAMSVIVGRALPDARDGLKPVHRRILHAMREAGNDHNKPFKKSARIVGDVLGKYHPHGGEAVYDSLVRMAQDFSMRAPLVDGQGNFGSVDGDNPAAMRYTEVRLSRIAAVLLEDLDKNTVDFVPNYDGAEKEPVVLPAQFPNLLVNGSAGIAVGMATNIPPHNLGEIVDACLHLIKKPDASAEELRRFVPAPDFPTGGLIHGLAGARDAYNTGRGRVVMRAKTHFEDLERGNRRAIVVDEIPYQVNKSVLAARIAELAREKKIEGIADLRDESDRTGIRLVIELRRGENEEVALNRLFKETQLQDSFSINMVALRDGEPKTLGLRELLKIFLDHRREVVVRRAVFDLARARDKAHLLEGFVAALENLDEIVELIKNSKSPAEAEQRLMEWPQGSPSFLPPGPTLRRWKAEGVEKMLSRLDDPTLARPENADPERGFRSETDGPFYYFSQTQAKGILEMRLSRLTAMEREKIAADYEKTVAEIAELLSLLSDPEKINALIADELRAVKKAHANPRRSVIDEAGADIDIESLIAEEDMVVTFSHRGYVKRQPASDYRAQRRGGRGRRAATAREDDFIQKVFVAGTHDYLLIFTNRGRVYWKKVYELPVASYTGRGKTLVSLMDSWADRESVQAVLPVRDFEGERFAVMATAGGTVKKTPLSAFSRPRPSGIIALTLENDRLVDAAITGGEHTITLATDAGKALRFHESKLRPMGRSARGVRGIRIPEGREVVNMLVADDEEAKRDSILIATENGYGKRTNFAEFPVKGRGGQGMIAVRVGAKNGKVVGAVEAQDTDDLMLITSGGVMVRTAMSSIRRMGRATTGVRLIALDQGAKLAGIARVADDGEDGGNGGSGENGEGGGGGE